MSNNLLSSSSHSTLRTTVILLAAAVCLALPIYFFGMPGGNDLPQHYRFAITFYDALRSGDIYPAWAGETNLGYGDVGVRFYPPLAYYVSAIFRMLVPDWNTALASAICFWFFIGGVGVYLLARESFSERASLAGALVFMLMPYHANQVYNAGLFAEFAGLAILPFCFLFVRRTVLNGTLGNLGALSVSYALLVLAHLPLLLVGSIALAAYSVVLLHPVRWDLTAIGRLAASVAVAVMASAFYWVKLIAEVGLVKHSMPEFTSKAYDFRFNFLGSLLYVPGEKYENSSLWFTDLLFVITLAMVVPCLLLALRRGAKIDRSWLSPVVAVFLIAIILGTPLSALLWEHVELLQKVQFPWRLLGLLALSGSLIIAASFEEIAGLFRTSLRPVGLIAAGLVFAGVVFTFAQVIRPAAYPDVASLSSSFEVLQNDQSYECWWPVWADRKALEDRRHMSESSRSVDVVRRSNYDREITVGPGPADRIRIATFYYPFWKATSNAGKLAVEPHDDGTILISVPENASNVRLSFVKPRYETFAQVISIAVWLALIITLVGGRLRRVAGRKIA